MSSLGLRRATPARLRAVLLAKAAKQNWHSSQEVVVDLYHEVD
jgi:hypothetical protein